MVTEKMNGNIECISKEGKGTLISFYITVKSSHDDHGLSNDENSKY
jgi:signal transduction histidine kinase